VPVDDMTNSLWMTETSKPGCGRSLAIATAPGPALSELTGSADYQYCDIGATDASQHPSSPVGEMWRPKLPARTIRTGHPTV
jgi:hypothetical protein